jgi:transcriptional regulator with XRE-family HTH domain
LTKDEIAATLKLCRIRAGFEAKEVAEKLISLGAIKSVKSFYNWESGRTQPDADTFMYLCDLYNVKDIMPTFGFAASYPSQSPLSEKISRLDNGDLEKAEAYIDGLLSQDKYNGEAAAQAKMA